MNIAGIEIGPGHPCRVVAEISNAHNGSLDRAHRLIEAAANAGADFIKTQCYTPAELVSLRGDGPAPEPWGSDGWTMRRLYEHAATPLQWFPSLVETCKKVGIPWFSSVFGPGSLAILEMLGCPAYKLASLDAGAHKLRRMVAETGKPVLRSLPTPRAPRGGDDLTLYCPPGYPQAAFPGLSGAFRGHTGFSYHGTDPLVPALAVAYGASLVECHFQLEASPSELEANVSLNERELSRMIEHIRTAEAVRGKETVS